MKIWHAAMFCKSKTKPKKSEKKGQPVRVSFGKKLLQNWYFSLSSFLWWQVFFERMRGNILHIFRAPDLTDHYNNSAASAMIHHGASGPLLSSAMANNTQQPHQTASNQQPAVHGQGGPGQAGQNNSAKHSHRHNITDYSPDWAWSDVSRLVRDIRN